MPHERPWYNRLAHVHAAVAAQPLRFSISEADAGHLSEGQHARLQGQLDEAVKAQDYREAATLQSIILAFGKNKQSDDPLARLAEATRAAQQASDADAMATQFLRQGFAIIPGAVPPETLPHVQAAWQRKQSQIEPLWRALVAAGASSNPRGWPGRFESRVSPRAFDMPTSDFFSGKDGRTLLEVVALPKVLELLERVLAPRAEIRLCGVQARTVIPMPAGDVGGYTNWHRDGSPAEGPGQDTGGTPPRHREIKVFLPVFPVSFDGGPSTVVPYTHRIPESARDQSVAQFATRGGLTTSHDGLDQYEMPNYVPFAVPAGTACVMDSSIWHAALPNTSSESRRQLILGYHHQNVRSGSGHIPSSADILRYEAEGGELPRHIKEVLGDELHRAGNTPAVVHGK